MSDLGLSRTHERKTKKLTTKRKSFTFRIYFLGSVTDMVDVQRTSLMEGSLPVFSASSFGSSFLILPMSAFRSFALSPFRFLPPAFLSSHFLCAFHSLFFFLSSIFFFFFFIPNYHLSRIYPLLSHLFIFSPHASISSSPSLFSGFSSFYFLSFPLSYFNFLLSFSVSSFQYPSSSFYSCILPFISPRSSIAQFPISRALFSYLFISFILPIPRRRKNHGGRGQPSGGGSPEGKTNPQREHSNDLLGQETSQPTS